MVVLHALQKVLEVPGFEPGALYMRSTCDTTTPHSRSTNLLRFATQDWHLDSQTLNTKLILETAQTY